MALVRDPNRKGLWTSSERLQAGVHAVVIGVSSYPYLAGGSAARRAPDNGGLGQLEVCARTAVRIFEWLHQAGGVAGASLATVRLLLAPHVDEEADVNASAGEGYAPADFTTIRTAIEEWADDIQRGGAAGGVNVPFFFFSGHGTEYMSSPAMLASDILNPDRAGAGRKAVSFLSLCSVKTLGIDRALFFVDACRDVPAVARLLNIVGEEILKPNPFPPRPHEALLALQSTKVGGSAFQVPGDSATIFGRAVLEALEGTPPHYAPYDTSAEPWRLIFARMERHVKDRVRELVAAQTATRFQQVVPYGDPYDGDMLIAEKSVTPPSARVSPTRGSGVVARETITPGSLEAILGAGSSDILSRFESPIKIQPSLVGAPRPPWGGLMDFNIMHDVLRHESATGPWIKNLQILDAVTGEAVAPDSITMRQGQSSEINEALTAWIDVIVAPGPGAIWIGDRGADTSFGLVLPRDLYPIPVRLELSFRLGPSTVLQAMAARVGDPDIMAEESPSANLWKALWRIQRVEALYNLGQAGMEAAHLAELEVALARKASSPVAAAIATTVLLRCGALDRLHDWPRNLADFFALPDGPLLWAETLLRRDERRRATEPATTLRDPDARSSSEIFQVLGARPPCLEARRYFADAAERGPPYLGASLTMAASRLSFWRNMLRLDLVSGEEGEKLEKACLVIEHAARSALPDGVFVGFAAKRKNLSPQNVLRGPLETGTNNDAIKFEYDQSGLDRSFQEAPHGQRYSEEH